MLGVMWAIRGYDVQSALAAQRRPTLIAFGDAARSSPGDRSPRPRICPPVPGWSPCRIAGTS